MNIIKKDILLCLNNEPCLSQRMLSRMTGHSLGSVNQALKELFAEGYIKGKNLLTEKALLLIDELSPENAVILAAGFGMRMVPVNLETPKGLIEVHGEILIERTIRQLREAGINDIYVVAGFMKERYEYLIDDFNVKLIINPCYKEKNNLYSLLCARDLIANTYIIPCDIWCRNTPYRKNELYTWYMIRDDYPADKGLNVNRRNELQISDIQSPEMIGIAYITAQDAPALKDSMKRLLDSEEGSMAFWEAALFSNSLITVTARKAPPSDVVEINTFEQLMALDENSEQLRSGAVEVICNQLGASPQDLKNIRSLKKGMTNRSFLFENNEKKYIMRIPGEGSEKLISRANEAAVYKVLNGKGISEDVIYIDPVSGYKLSLYMDNARTADPKDPEDVKKCMKALKFFHGLDLRVYHRFDLFGLIDHYEELREGAPSLYRDYEKTKENILSLKKIIDGSDIHECLTHIDAVPDNFLIAADKDAERLRLIDWEYAAMADPHIDLAMFSIYSFYSKDKIDELIEFYFGCEPDQETKIKIYCYVAACGLLWSNWCEYKYSLGVDFGEYSMRQYRYAKDFYRIVKKELQDV